MERRQVQGKRSENHSEEKVSAEFAFCKTPVPETGSAFFCGKSQEGTQSEKTLLTFPARAGENGNTMKTMNTVPPGTTTSDRLSTARNYNVPSVRLRMTHMASQRRIGCQARRACLSPETLQAGNVRSVFAHYRKCPGWTRGLCFFALLLPAGNCVASISPRVKGPMDPSRGLGRGAP